MPILYTAEGGQWRRVKAVHVGHEGVWKPEKIRLVGHEGRWKESFDTETATPNEILNVFSLSYRAGAQLQGALDIKGSGIRDVVVPEPRVGAFYTFGGVTEDYFSNFGKLNLYGTELPLPTLEDGTAAYAFDGTQQQYAALPNTGSGVYDLLGLLGNDANAIYEPRGKTHWEMGGKVKPKSWPTGSNMHFLVYSGTPSQNIAVWFDALGTLYARFKNGNYAKVLSIPNAVSLNQWVSFIYRHRPAGTTRYLELDVMRPNGTGDYEMLSASYEADIQRNVDGTLYKEFSYWLPPPDQPIYIGHGIQDGGTQNASKFFLPENTHPALQISEDGLELLGTQTLYRNAVPSGWMVPGTGKYYIEFLNRDSYDIHFGVTDAQVVDLAQAPGVIGWAVNTINGRKFSKQTGGGTAWTSAIPADSVIGMVYDSDQGLLEVYVNGVMRVAPFPAGTITGPVRFIIGGRAQSAAVNLFNPRVRLSPALWAYPPTGTFGPVPYTQVEAPGGPSYTTGVFRDFIFRNQPMSSDSHIRLVLAPSLKFEVLFERISTGDIYLVNSYVLKLTSDLVTISVPDLPDGNYLVRYRLVGYEESISRLFTIRSFEARSEQLLVDFSVASLDHIRKELMLSHKGWGGLNGGTSADNVLVNLADGVCELTAYGDLYTGPVKGTNRVGEPSGFNTRIGACLVTRDYFGPGSYRILVKPAERPGVCNAIWSFHYEEGYQGSVLFNRHLADGLHISGDEVSGFNTVRNHEIDIEFPTALKTNPNQEDVSFLNARFNTWRGELRNWDVPNKDVPVGDPMYSPENHPEYWSEYTDDFVHHGVNLGDGQFHELRYDWHLGQDPRVEFYIDGVLQYTVRTHVPDIPGRYWAGMWFPSGSTQWAGRGAPWVFEKMIVKKIEIIPFVDQLQHARMITETYPNDVFRDFKNVRYE